MELAAHAAEGRRATALAAALHAQLSVLCSSIGADEAAAADGDDWADRKIAALCLWVAEVGSRDLPRRLWNCYACGCS
jgi:hypothetical protein